MHWTKKTCHNKTMLSVEEGGHFSWFTLSQQTLGCKDKMSQPIWSELKVLKTLGCESKLFQQMTWLCKSRCEIQNVSTKVLVWIQTIEEKKLSLNEKKLSIKRSRKTKLYSCFSFRTPKQIIALWQAILET